MATGEQLVLLGLKCDNVHTKGEVTTVATGEQLVLLRRDAITYSLRESRGNGGEQLVLLR